MENFQAIADKSAITISALCALHCLLFPAAVILYPNMFNFFPGDEVVHLVLLFLVIPISSFALFKGAKLHKSRTILLAGLIGMLILIAAVVFGHDMLGEAGEKILTLMGSLIVVGAHIRNHLICRIIDCDCHEEETACPTKI